MVTFNRRGFIAATGLAAFGSVGTARAAAGFKKFVDPLRIPPVFRPERGQMTLRMRLGQSRLHSALPPTTMWTFEGHSPGPTIEVRRGEPVRIAWINEITGQIPVAHVDLPRSEDPPGLPPERRPHNIPGVDPRFPLNPDVAALSPFTVVHLHGGTVPAGADGQTENGLLRGQTQLVEYENKQQAATLWYHDHAMAVTRWNVFAGLAGMYIVRDDEERALGLPEDIPLILSDRNLNTGPDGRLTGELLHKTVNRRAFVGPYNLVNGTIWPYLDVEPRWYRFRVLNASNGRTYSLRLDGARILQIGTDLGLLGAPVPVDELVLAPAERADILVDFSRARGRELQLVNHGEVPQPEPAVMQFRVGRRTSGTPFVPPAKLSPSFQRLTHDTPHQAHRTLVVMLNTADKFDLWEVEEIPAPPGRLPIDGIVQIRDSAGVVRTFKRLSRTFDDTVNWYVGHGTTEQWTIYNFTDEMHPMHVHLMKFQPLAREVYDWEPNVVISEPVIGSRVPVPYTRPGVVRPNEAGWKDTIQVASGEKVTILGRFEGGAGRYIYHCHLLEHEDMGMMRPFVVLPTDVLKFHRDMSHPHR